MPNLGTDYFLPEKEIRIPTDIRFHPKMSFGEKLFYSEIKSICQKNPKKSCNLTCKALCGIFGVSAPTVLKWLRNLAGLNLIEVSLDFNNNESRQCIKIKNNELA